MIGLETGELPDALPEIASMRSGASCRQSVEFARR
jgi:hypothetical protein